MMQFSFCNELLADEGHSLDRQCEIAAGLGYAGLELALGAMTDRPHEITDAQITEIRRTVEAHGLRVTGLHWLLAPYPNLSITDPVTQEEAGSVLVRLVDICAGLGGRVLVHGSPGQRQPPEGVSAAVAESGLADFFAPVARAAEKAGVIYCLEPLSASETSVITSVDAAFKVVDAVGSTAFLTMIDTSAAGRSETLPVPALMAKYLGDPRIAHIHLNDTNRGGPGMGSDPFVAVVREIHAANWTHPVTVEPFRTVIDGAATAALAIGTLRAALEAVTSDDQHSTGGRIQ